MRYFLKIFYLWAVNKTKVLASDIEEIEDIILISKLNHKHFVYGQSDLRLVFVIENDAHPKQILSQIREGIKPLWPANILVNTDELSVLKRAELETPMIRSFLVKKFFQDKVKWKSICTKEIYSFNLKPQDHFSIQYEYLRNIENFIFNVNNNFLSTNEEFRSFTKKIYNSITGLKRYDLITKEISKEWNKLAVKTMGFSFFKNKKYEKFKLLSFIQVDGISKEKKLRGDLPENYEEEFLSFCVKLVNCDYIYDLFLAPAFIQLDHHHNKGRIYIDVLLDTKNITASKYDKLIDSIKGFQKSQRDSDTRFIFNITTYEINHLKDTHILSDYPLRGFYRAQQGYSFNEYKYEYSTTRKQIERAAIHYLLTQFMFFRSKEHREQLLGSKFIKSLNLIYQYKLLLENLKGKEFAISHNYKSIMEELGVQLYYLRPDDVINEENWNIIRAQMLFILKQIRDELSKKYLSLKNIQF